MPGWGSPPEVLNELDIKGQVDKELHEHMTPKERAVAVAGVYAKVKGDPYPLQMMKTGGFSNGRYDDYIRLMRKQIYPNLNKWDQLLNHHSDQQVQG